jgi:phosphatidate cytidylyltransferase
MLRTRLWVGTLLAAATACVLVGDAGLRPYFPFLFACVAGLGVLATRELLFLLHWGGRPRLAPATTAVLVILASNWWAITGIPTASPWEPVLFAFTGATLVAFLFRMASYRAPEGNVVRIANAILAAAYLGVLPSFLVRIRFDAAESGLALTAAIFVPKCGDIGAYMTGRVIGRTPFSPHLSPKKTWEGFAGGMAFSIATAVAIHYLGDVFRHGFVQAVVFGVAVGLAGVLGDLAESMMKREGLTKDASKSVPGFGGVLDVIDSVLFAAPVAYLVLRL